MHTILPNPPDILEMELDGTNMERGEFLSSLRKEMIRFTGRWMRLDALIHEIAKNIYDHAGKKGYVKVAEPTPEHFTFIIKDHGGQPWDFWACRGKSTKVGNGTNYNIGLQTILDLARNFKIIVCIDTSNGFCYSGTYIPAKTEKRTRKDFDVTPYLK